MLKGLRAVRNGKLYDSAFGQRMRGQGIFADQIDALFEVACRKHGLNNKLPPLSTAGFRRVEKAQLSLF